jgi:hypothetical protein
MWAMVLFIGVGGPLGGGLAPTSILGFDSMATCQEAGEKIMHFVYEAQPRYLCVLTRRMPPLPPQSPR